MTGLGVRNLTVRFGGHVAVNDVTFSAPLGMITGLIGPNGAGKTTTFNACNGLLRPNGGAVDLFAAEVTSLSPAARASRGLGRTFQRVEVCNSLSVRTNVALGCEARLVGGNPIRQVISSRGQRQEIEAATDAALDTCGITGIAQRRTATLSTGQRRLLELARVLAGGFRFLMLDEPSSGLDSDETARFGAILRQVVQERDVGILLVEHDMSLVMEVCDYLYVLDFGHLIFEGTARDTMASDVVRTAYLGREAPGESR